MVRARAAPQPNPVRAIFVLLVDYEENPPHHERRFDCALYDACLDQAVESEWPGFSCHECKVQLLAPSALRRHP